MENRHTGFGCKELKEVLLFQTTSTVLWLSEKMSSDGHAVTPIQDGMTVDERLGADVTSRNGRERLLITTEDLTLEAPEVKN